MFADALILAAAFEILPFYQQKPDYTALRPLWSSEEETTDVIWPVFTSHRDWWRFCWFVHEQDFPEGGYQFDVLPLWWNGREGRRKKEEGRGKKEEGRSVDGESYWGLFPLWGSHPHLLMMHDLRFCLWPLWMQYRMPRKSADGGWMTTNAVLFPFFHWRDDGAWGAWPLYGVNHQRESDHRYVLWPLVTWADYRADRDTGGEGRSWMFWPLYGQIRRERERQDLFIPPFFSWTETYPKSQAAQRNSAPDMRLRCPWPIFEWESTARRDRLSVWPLYERVRWNTYAKGEDAGSVTRFGWKLVELYDEETRVFPFWVSRKDGSYFRLWPFWESSREKDGSVHGRFLSLFPIRWVPAIDRNWAKFWTFYESDANQAYTDHSLFWGIVRWRTFND